MSSEEDNNNLPFLKDIESETENETDCELSDKTDAEEGRDTWKTVKRGTATPAGRRTGADKGFKLFEAKVIRENYLTEREAVVKARRLWLLLPKYEREAYNRRACASSRRKSPRALPKRKHFM